MPDSNITKRALAGAMKTLMQSHPFAKISVRDICEQCGMNRKSFYYHFRDKYDLVNWIYYTEFIAEMRQKDYADGWAFVSDMYAYFYANRVFYVNALKVTGQDSFREYFGEVFQPVVRSTIETVFLSVEHQTFYTTFFTDAILIALERWLAEGTMTPQQFVALLRTCIEGTSRYVVSQMKAN